MKHNDWTNVLRERLADSKAPVPDNLWDKIEARMDMASSGATDVPERTRPASVAPRRLGVVRMVWWASAAAVLVAVVLVGLHVSDDSMRQVAVVERQVARHRYRVIWPTDSGGLVVAQAASAGSAVGVTESVPLVSGSDGVIAVSCANDAVSDTVVPARCETPVNDLEQIPPAATAPVHAKVRKNKANTVYYGGEQATVSRRHWNVSLHADGVAISSQNAQRPMLMAAANGGIRYEQASDGCGGSVCAAPIGFNAYSALAAEYSEKKHHARPVSVGLSVGIPLAGRFTLVTGAVYTSASTDFVSSVAGSEVVEKQRLHYIGVPLAVKVAVWSTGGLHTYVSGGAQADFNVAARLTSGGVSKNIEKDRPQFSLGAAAGVQYDVVNSLGLYAEPGLKYYIDNGSGVETIFKENKINFSLQLGLRYGF